MITDKHNGVEGEHEGIIKCMVCGNVFSLREGEQDFFIQRGLDLPKRCPPCRAERKAQASVGGPRTVSSSRVECDHCNRLTVVPFVPIEGSEVYCRVCWEGIKNVGTAGAIYV